MNKKYLLKISVCLLMAGFLVLGAVEPVASAKDNEDVKVKVFVHYPKPDGDNGKVQRPTCQITVDDHATSYGLTGWELPTTPVTFRINYNSKPANLSSANVKAAVNNAFVVWATSSVSFLEGAGSSASRAQNDGVNLVAWGSVPNNAIGVTYTWYYQSTGQWVESDTILNKKLKWAWTPYSTDCAGITSAYDVQNIMTHENGHWVGLDDLYDLASRDLTMYGYGVTGELKKDTLGWGDILGIKAIY